MKKSHENNNNSNPDPYEDMIRLQKLDPYEALIKSNSSKINSKSIFIK